MNLVYKPADGITCLYLAKGSVNVSGPKWLLIGDDPYSKKGYRG